MKLKYFYKIENNRLIKGTGYSVPEGFIEYDKNNPPQEFSELQKQELFKQAKTSKLAFLKSTRKKLTAAIKITLNNRKELNGDEKSQDRMNRAINGLPDDTTIISWIDYNNEIIELTKPELKEALQRAGQAQTEIFIKYNELRKQLDNAKTIEEIESITWE